MLWMGVIVELWQFVSKNWCACKEDKHYEEPKKAPTCSKAKGKKHGKKSKKKTGKYEWTIKELIKHFILIQM